MTPEIITAIAGLWKLGAVLLFSFVIIHWRKDWPGLLKGLYVRGKWEARKLKFEGIYRRKLNFPRLKAR